MGEERSSQGEGMEKAAVALALSIAAGSLAAATAAAQEEQPAEQGRPAAAAEPPAEPPRAADPTVPEPAPPAPAVVTPSAPSNEITQAEFEAAAGAHGFNRSCLRLTDAARGFANALAAMNGQRYTPHGTGFSVEICTPANWIARKMAQAKRQYQQLGWADLQEQDRVKVLHVLALPDRTTNLNVENGDSVAHVVLRHPDKKLRQAVVVQPLFKRPFGVEQQNNLGGVATLEGVDAAFPLEALATVRDEKGEFLVTVVGEGQEKNFKVKQKHLDDLGLRDKW